MDGGIGSLYIEIVAFLRNKRSRNVSFERTYRHTFEIFLKNTVCSSNHITQVRDVRHLTAPSALPQLLESCLPALKNRSRISHGQTLALDWGAVLKEICSTATLRLVSRY